ncbi:hypothetical protein F1559_004419 [Cyanidiococcus yangmingshanensis]|uniref:Uncharacterized protein n=1 Tax=Cyanidiococcus yangmingshanensis TaxID=2690220 RepID=A0A7J7ILI6_9RHOD|nr:hypothetical protein F1559_004419 [Cyanidiococcus yangmingshanensis]
MGRLTMTNSDPAQALWEALERILETLALPVRMLALETRTRPLLERLVKTMSLCLEASPALSRSFWISVWLADSPDDVRERLKVVRGPETTAAACFWRELCTLMPLTAELACSLAQAALADPVCAFLALHYFQRQCLTVTEPWSDVLASTIELHPETARDEIGLQVHRLKTKCIRKTATEPETCLPAGAQGLVYETYGFVIWKVHWDGFLVTGHCMAGLELLQRLIDALLRPSLFDWSPTDEPVATLHSPSSLSGASILESACAAIGHAEETRQLLLQTLETLWRWIQTHWARLVRLLDPQRFAAAEKPAAKRWRVARARAVAALAALARIQTAKEPTTPLSVNEVISSVLDPLAPVPEIQAEAVWLARAWSQQGSIPVLWSRWLTALPAELLAEPSRCPSSMFEAAEVRFELVSRAIQKRANVVDINGVQVASELIVDSSTSSGPVPKTVPLMNKYPFVWHWWQHGHVLECLWVFACQLLDHRAALLGDSWIDMTRLGKESMFDGMETQRESLIWQEPLASESIDAPDRGVTLLLAMLRFLQTMLAFVLMTPQPRQTLLEQHVPVAIRERWRRAQWQLLVADPARFQVLDEVLWHCLHPEAAPLIQSDFGPDPRAFIEAFSRRMGACIWSIWALVHLAMTFYMPDAQQVRHALHCLWPEASHGRLVERTLIGLELDPQPVLVFLVAASAAGHELMLGTIPDAVSLPNEKRVPADAFVSSKVMEPAVAQALPGERASRPTMYSLRSSRLWMALWQRQLFIPVKEIKRESWLAPLAVLVFRRCLCDVSLSEAQSWLTSLFRDLLVPWRRHWRAQIPPWSVAFTTTMALASFLELERRLWVQQSASRGMQSGTEPKLTVDAELVSSWLELIELLIELTSEGASNRTSRGSTNDDWSTASRDHCWPEGLVVLNEPQVASLETAWPATEQMLLMTILASDLDGFRLERATDQQPLPTRSASTLIPWLQQTVLMTSLEVLVGALQAPQPSWNRCILDLRLQQSRLRPALFRLSLALLQMIDESSSYANAASYRLIWSELLFRQCRVWTRQDEQAHGLNPKPLPQETSSARRYLLATIQTIELQLERLSSINQVILEQVDLKHDQSDSVLLPSLGAMQTSPHVLIEVAAVERLVLALCQTLEALDEEQRSSLTRTDFMAGEVVCLRLLEHAGRWPSMLPSISLLCQRWFSDKYLQETECASRGVRAVYQALSLAGQTQGRWWLAHLLLWWTGRSPICAELISKRGLCCLEPIQRAHVRQRLTSDRTRPLADWQLYVLLLHLYAVLLDEAAVHTSAATQQRLWTEVHAFVASFEGAPLQPPWLCRPRLESLSQHNTAAVAWTSPDGAARLPETTAIWYGALCEELFAVACFVEALVSCRHRSNRLQELEAQWSLDWMQQLGRQVIGAAGDALRCLRSAPTWLALSLRNAMLPTSHLGPLKASIHASSLLDKSGTMRMPALNPHRETPWTLTLGDLVERAILRLVSSALELSNGYLVLAPTMNWSNPETSSLGMCLTLVLHWLNALGASSSVQERQARQSRLLEVSLLFFLEQLMHHVEHGTLPAGFVEECSKRLVGLENRLNGIAESAFSGQRRHRLLKLLHAVEMLLSRGRNDLSRSETVSIARNRDPETRYPSLVFE